MALLEVRGLAARYGEHEAIHGASLEVSEGEFVAIIGPNGAGKSTLLKSIAGLVKPAAGSVLLAGKDIVGLPPYEIARHGVVMVPQGRRVFGSMTVSENLEMGAFVSRASAGELAERMEHVFTYFPALKQKRSSRARVLSGGEQQMLAIGRALMLEPKLLLLDEPSLGLSPVFVQRVLEKIREINEEQHNTPVLLVEQNAVLALKASSRAYVLDAGRIALHGASKNLLKSERVRKSYLGL